MTSILSRKGHHSSVFKEAAYLWRKRSSHVYALSHVNYEGHCKVNTSPSRWTNYTDALPRLSETEKNIYVTVNGNNEENGVGWYLRVRRASVARRPR